MPSLEKRCAHIISQIEPWSCVREGSFHLLCVTPRFGEGHQLRDVLVAFRRLDDERASTGAVELPSRDGGLLAVSDRQRPEGTLWECALRVAVTGRPPSRDGRFPGFSRLRSVGAVAVGRALGGRALGRALGGRAVDVVPGVVPVGVMPPVSLPPAAVDAVLSGQLGQVVAAALT